MPPAHPRKLYIDLARAAAITMIVTAHLLRRGPAADYLSSTGVAMFFFLSGLVYHFQTGRRAEDHTKEEQNLSAARRAYWRGRFRKLYLPYLGAGLVSIIIYQFLGQFAARSLGMKWQAGSGMAGRLRDFASSIAALFYANSKDHSMKWNEPLWFIPCFLVTLLLVNGWERLLHRNRYRETTQICCRLIACLLLLLLHYFLTQHLHTHLPWQAETAFGMFPVYEAGIITHKISTLENNRQHLVLPALWQAVPALLLILFQILLTRFNGQISIRGDIYPHYPLSFVVLLTGCAGYILLCHSLTRPAAPAPDTASHTSRRLRPASALQAALAYTGRHSLDILLWNKFPVLFFQVVVPHFIPGFTRLFLEQNTLGGVLVSLLLSIPSMVLCLLFAAAIHRFSVLSRAR